MIGWIVGIIIAGLIIWNAIDNFKKNQERYIDKRGYERDGHHRLIHRRVAYNHHYSDWRYKHRFSYYDVHHKDGNKRNNNPSNLQILTRDEHKKIHGH